MAKPELIGEPGAGAKKKQNKANKEVRGKMARTAAGSTVLIPETEEDSKKDTTVAKPSLQEQKDKYKGKQQPANTIILKRSACSHLAM